MAVGAADGVQRVAPPVCAYMEGRRRQARRDQTRPRTPGGQAWRLGGRWECAHAPAGPVPDRTVLLYVGWAGDLTAHRVINERAIAAAGRCQLIAMGGSCLSQLYARGGHSVTLEFGPPCVRRCVMALHYCPSLRHVAAATVSAAMHGEAPIV